VIITARLISENAQDVPVSLTVLGSETLRSTSTFNPSLVAQVVPSLNYTSANPRNTALTIRGLGSSVLAVGQSNDGLEPGVGFYVDGVYHARPATAAFDFLDVEEVEVLRGPQGTVFGKNTTAGAVLVKTRDPSFSPDASGEVSIGDYGLLQSKASLSGALVDDKVAGRVSVVEASRYGMLKNVVTGGRDNSLGTWGLHGQLLIRPDAALTIRLSADDNAFDATCCTQVFVRVGQTLKSAARQFPALATGLGYAPPSLDPYARLTDIDAPLSVKTDEDGLSSTIEWTQGEGKATSITAWRFWNWDAANDRDYTGLSIQTLQHIPSRQDQYSQEFRYTSRLGVGLTYVVGVYAFNQGITGRPITQYGPLATYWLLGPATQYPSGLLNGYGTDGRTRFHSTSYAAFGEATWKPVQRLSLVGGLRFTDEDKSGSYASTVYGGATPTSTAQANAKLSILRPQAYQASNSNGSLSGRMMATWKLTSAVNLYASAARTEKSGGLNMSGLPLTAANQPALATAVIRPEKNTTFEAGLKSQLLSNTLRLNADVFQTDVRNFQTNIVDSSPGALRGYLADSGLIAPVIPR
jgi:iron complex outermembrane receptor protein